MSVTDSFVWIVWLFLRLQSIWHDQRVDACVVRAIALCACVHVCKCALFQVCELAIPAQVVSVVSHVCFFLETQ